MLDSMNKHFDSTVNLFLKIMKEFNLFIIKKYIHKLSLFYFIILNNKNSCLFLCCSFWQMHHISGWNFTFLKGYLLSKEESQGIWKQKFHCIFLSRILTIFRTTLIMTKCYLFNIMTGLGTNLHESFSIYRVLILLSLFLCDFSQPWGS